MNDQAEIVAGWPRAVFFLLSLALVAAFAAYNVDRARPLVWLGDVSFGLYITHPIVFGVCKYFLGVGVPTLVLAVGLTLFASTLSYYLFERPITDWGKRRTSISKA